MRINLFRAIVYYKKFQFAACVFGYALSFPGMYKVILSRAISYFFHNRDNGMIESRKHIKFIVKKKTRSLSASINQENVTSH